MPKPNPMLPTLHLPMVSPHTFYVPSDIANLLQPLEDAINLSFILVLMAETVHVSPCERNLFASLTHLGGLSISKPTETAPTDFAYIPRKHYRNDYFSHCYKVTMQSTHITPWSNNTMMKLKSIRWKNNKQTVSCLETSLHQHLSRAAELSRERGASSWLSCPPIEEHGFALHRGTSTMLSAFTIIGNLNDFLQDASVAMHFLVTMHSAVLPVGFEPLNKAS